MAGACSLRDSLWLTFTTVISNGAGASLGMEAGYSQLGAGLYSWLGRWFRLRRADLRVFVTAGAGAAIAAAFNAPLAGAFYGYELILGSYTTKALAPVMVATVSAALTQRAMSHMKALFEVTGGFNVTSGSYFLFALLGVGAAGVAVAAMQAVTWTERSLRASGLPDWLRPALGGLLLSGLALYAPASAGQRAWRGAISFRRPLDLLGAGGSAGDEAGGFRDLRRGGLSRRLVQFGAVPGHVVRGGVRARRGLFFARSGSPAQCLHAGGHGRGGGGHYRRAAHHGVPGPGSDGRFPGHHCGGDCGDRGLHHRAHPVRLFLRHLALSSARAFDPRRP